MSSLLKHFTCNGILMSAKGHSALLRTRAFLNTRDHLHKDVSPESQSLTCHWLKSELMDSKTEKPLIYSVPLRYQRRLKKQNWFVEDAAWAVQSDPKKRLSRIMEIIETKGSLIHTEGNQLSTSILPWGFDNKVEHQMRQAAQNSGNTFHELPATGLM